MSVRFRIRTPGGQELSFASHEMFEDFVRSGELSPDDLVYDRETGSWSPARTHPTVLEIQYEQEAEEEAAQAPPVGDAADGSEAAAGPGDEATPSGEEDAAGREEDAPGTGEAGTGPEEREPMLEMGDDLGLDLAVHEEESAEEAKRRLIEKLEAEREAERDPGGPRESLAGFMVDSGSAELIRTERPGERPRPTPEQKRMQEQRSKPKPRSPAASRRPQRGTSPALSGKGRAARPSRAATGRGRKEAPGRKGGLGRFLFLLLLLGVVAAGAWMGYQLLQAGPETGLPEEEGPTPAAGAVSSEPAAREPGPTPPPARPADGDPADAVLVAAAVSGVDSAGGEPGDTGVAPAAAEPVIPATPAAVRERARERYLASTQAGFRDLEPVPEIWPEGPYLSVPTDHPGVVDVWQQYRATIRDVRASDEERYRTAYEAALDDAGIEGEEREERLTAAMAAFRDSAPAREAHFDRVEALATAAIQSHDALVEAEGLILWDATGSTGPGSGIGQGVSGRDAESQLLLDQVVELLTAALDADGEGPGAPENVREWVWDGFLDAATR